jgi:MoxR-like ATPase
VPWVEETIGQNPDIPTPLVIITTNEERELPAAFIRRCLVLNLRLPEKLLDWLCERGRIHFPDTNGCTDRVLDKAAQQLIKDREQARQQGVAPPGQAEYIDLLKATTTLAKDEQKQLELLERLSHFALKKYPQ